MIAFVGDTHFGRKAENPTIKKHIDDGQSAFFDWLVDDLNKKGIKKIFFSGDIFDTRNSINLKALIDTKRLFQTKLRNFDISIVLGNHDMYYENSYDVTSLELLEELPNVHVYRKDITSIHINGYDMYIIPWIIHDELPSVVNFLDTLKSNREKNILFGHFEMIGIDMEGGNVSTFGLSPNVFADAAKYVLSGHYHGSSIQEIDGSKILYFGSPYPLTFANSDSVHGYWTWDENNGFSFVENPVSPTFKTIMDTDDLTNLGDLSKSFVRLYINNAKTKEEVFSIKTLIESKKPIYTLTIPYKNGSDEKSKSEAQRNSNKLFNMDLFSLSEIYIDNNSDSLPRLRQNTDSKNAVMTRIRDYISKVNLKK